jgi:hypothetical protein
MLRIRPSVCLYTDIDSIHLHTTHIWLSSLPLGVFILTKGWIIEDGGGNISQNGIKGGKINGKRKIDETY